MEKDVLFTGAAEGERSSTGAAPEVKRWSANRKKEVVLRMMRGEPCESACNIDPVLGVIGVQN